MRKFTLLLCAALTAATSLAQTNKGGQMLSLRQSVEQQHQMRQAASPIGAKAMHRAPAAPTGDETGLTDQPEGTLYESEVMSLSGLCYNWFYGWQNLSSDAAEVNIVEGTDGCVYVKGLQTMLYGDDYFWLKAEPLGNDLYTIKMQPAAAYFDYLDNAHTYYVARLQYYYDEETGYDGYELTDDTDITIWYKDGVLKTVDEMNPAAGEVAQSCIGTVYWYEAEEDDDYESGWYDNNEYYWSITTAPLTETYSVPGADATIEDMVISYLEAGEAQSQMVKVAFEGNNVYLRLYTSVPGWVKGTIDGDKVRIENCQYAGIDSNYGGHNWIHTATVETLYDEEDDYTYDHGTIVDAIELAYDATTRTMTAAEGEAIYYDGARNRIYYAAHYVQPVVKFFEEVAAVPADPIIRNYWDYDDYYGNAELNFTLPTTDVDGNYITTEKLSYCVYVDDELFEADADEYGFDESMTEFPYGFRSPYGAIGSSYFCVLFQPAVNMGLQAIYRGAGVEHRSNVVVYDIESGQIEKRDDTTVGLRGISHTGRGTIATYDLTGRRASAATRGLVVKRMVTADGHVKTVKTVNK